MNFDFTDEQRELQDQIRRFLRDRCKADVPRRVLEGDAPYDRELWDGVVEMGWLGVAIPEEYGGIGMGYLELCLIAEELGRFVAPIPFSSSIYLAAEALLRFGSEEQKQEYVPKLAAGEIIGTLAVAEGMGAPTADSMGVTFDGSKLSGEKIPVPDGDIADIGIVVAKHEGGVSLVLVDLNGSGVKREAVKTVDPTRSHARITFDGAAGQLIGEAGGGWDALQKLFDVAAVLFAFEQVGGADACIRMAREFVTERYAFGRPVGSFQAVKHRMADMYIKTELAKSNAYYGAWALSTDAPELPLAAAGARVAATEAYHFASKESIQVHGGMGFTWEADCHFFYRRSKLLALTIGAPGVWKDRLVSALEQTALSA